MTNLLQKNKEIESHHTNCTTCPDCSGFGFLPTHRQTQKKLKAYPEFLSGSNFLPTRDKKQASYKIKF